MIEPYVPGRYYGWNGGECPVRVNTCVKIWCRNGDTYEGSALDFYWDHRSHDDEYGRDGNIVAFYLMETEI